MPEIKIPQLLATPVHVWVKCEEARQLSEMETGCLILDAWDELQLIFVHPEHCELNKGLVRGVKVGTAPDDRGSWLIDFPSAERLVVPEERVELVNGSPV